MVAPIADDFKPSYDLDRLLTDVLNVGKLEVPELEPPNLTPLRVTLSEVVIELELEAGGVFRRCADNAISLVGSISDYEGLAKTTALRVVEV